MATLDPKKLLPSAEALVREMLAELPVELIKSRMRTPAPEPVHGSPGAKKERRDVDLIAAMRFRDEAAFGELCLKLSSDENAKISLLLDNLPPYGDEFVANFLQRKNQEVFRKNVLLMTVKESETKHSTMEASGPKGSRVVKKAERISTRLVADVRSKFLKDLASKIDISNADGSFDAVLRELSVKNLIVSKKVMDSYVEKLTKDSPAALDAASHGLDGYSRFVNRFSAVAFAAVVYLFVTLGLASSFPQYALSIYLAPILLWTCVVVYRKCANIFS